MKPTVITAFFIAILLFISFHFLVILSPFTGPILFAAVLAFAFFPLHQAVGRAVRHEAASAAVTTLLVLAAAVPVIAAITGKVSEEAVRGAQWLTAWIRDREYVAFVDWLSSLPVVDRARSTGLFDRLKSELGGWVSDSLASWGKFAASQAALVTKNMLLLAVNALLTVFFFFVFLKDGRRIVGFVERILPLDDDNKKEVMRQLRETFAAVIHGQVLSAFIKSAVVGVTFWLMGLPLPALVAVIAFFASLLPIVGAAAVWFPFVVYLAAQQDWTRAGILFVIGAGPVNLVDNVIHPLVIGQRSGLPYALLLVGVIGGVTQYGPFGIFIGPVVMSLFFALIKIYRHQFIDKQEPAKP
jgi:predicted PurR-regulated permease PerM